MPKQVVVPLQQHIGAPCEAAVKKGDVVEEGQLIGTTTSFISAPVHATISGKVKDVSRQPHPLGGKVLSVVITGDGTEKDWGEGRDDKAINALDPSKIKEIVRDAGIVGLGGAAFPTVVKLSPPEGTVVDTILLNGCECEPYLTADHRLMVEEPEKVLLGLKTIMKAVGAGEGIIGIEDNKQDAAEALKKASVHILPGVKIVMLETKYPQGAEKMLIHAVLGRKVPLGKLPLDVGVVVHNVGTAVAIYDAVKYGKPILERVVTVSGNAITAPGNFLVRVGTSFKEMIDLAEGIVDTDGVGEKEVLNGGPMMGIAQTDLSVPVIKGTSGVTVLSMTEMKPRTYDPCIRCASCVEVCPMNLMPYRIGDLGRMLRPALFKEWMGLTCIECGCCSFVCPSKRPLVEWIRVGKVKVRLEERKSAA